MVRPLPPHGTDDVGLSAPQPAAPRPPGRSPAEALAGVHEALLRLGARARARRP